MFNKDLLTWYKGLQFKEQYMNIDPVLPLDIINKEEEYKVKEVQDIMITILCIT